MWIERLEVQAFRGFGEPVMFDFGNADVILVYGPNGHGKTSLFDAVEWGLTGRIMRYEDENTNESQKKFRYIGNQLYTDVQPRVKIVLRDRDNCTIEVLRIGTAEPADSSDQGKSELALIIDGEALKGTDAVIRLEELLVHRQWLGKLQLDDGLFLTHLLSQERMNRFMRGMTEQDRYNKVSLVLGTERFNRYRKIFLDAKNELRKQAKNFEMQMQRTLSRLFFINEEIDKCNLKLDLRSQGSSQKNWEEQLHSLFAKYLAEFEGRSNGGVNHSSRLDEMLKHVAGNERAIQERDDALADRERNWRATREVIQKWKQDQPDYEKLLYKLHIYRELEAVERERETTQWLTDFYPEFSKLNGELSARISEIEMFENNLQALREEQAAIERALAPLQWKLEQAHYDENSYSLSDHVAMELVVLERLGFGRLVESVKAFDKIAQTKRLLQERLDSKRNELQYMNYHVEMLQEEEQKYQNLLQTVQEYIAVNDDLQSCPACGTTGLNASDMLQRIKKAQNSNHPKLGDVMETKIAFEREISATETEVKQVTSDLTRSFEILAEAMDKIRQAIDIFQRKIAEILRRISDLQNEIRLSKDLEREYSKRAEEVGLDTDSNHYRQLLTSKLNKLETERTALADKLGNPKLSNWRQDLQKLKAEFKRVDELREEVRVRVAEWSESPQTKELPLEQLEAQFHARLKPLQEERETVERRRELIREIKGRIADLDKLKEYENLQLEKDAQNLRKRELQARLLRLEQQMDLCQEVYRSIPDAIDNLNEEVMEELFETMRSIFVKLNSHPLFEEIAYNKEKKHNANRLFLTVLTGKQYLSKVDEEESVEVNPSYIFSAAQINAVALSFFLAMAVKQQWSPLQLIGMDDPVQSMDDLNVLAMIDLIRLLAGRMEEHEKQFIISTHDSTFHELMLKKFRYLNVRVIEYRGFSETGPKIDQYINEALPKESALLAGAWSESE